LLSLGLLLLLDLLNWGVSGLGSDSDLAFGLGLDERDRVGEVLGRTLPAFGVVRLHNLDLDTQNTLSEEYVPDGIVDIVDVGLTRVNHEPIDELHRFGTGRTEFTGDDDFATFGAGFHDESEDTVAGSPHSQTTQQLVPQALGLSSRRQTPELDLLGIELQRVFGEFEPLLNQRLELSDPSSLVAQNVLGVGSPDDNFGTGVGDSDFTSRVTFLGELSGEELSLPFPLEDRNHTVSRRI